MTTFDDREKAYEKKFAHDQELAFKASARRNKLLGQWVAGKIGLTGTDVDDYAKEVVKSDLQEPGDEDVFRKVRSDLDDKGVSISDDEVRGKMLDLMGEAVKQIEAGE